MQLWNTLSGKKEPLPRPKGKPVGLFVCGPTVYDHAHLGHARTYLVFDALATYLRSQGIKITYLQNITDIDDKIIARAKEEQVAPQELATRHARMYMKDMQALGIGSVTKYAAATDYIPEIVGQVQTLLDKKRAYGIPGDGIYFDITKFPDYGRLARRTAMQAEDAVSRIDEGVGKRNKGDFALWKFSKDGEPSWDSPFGAGRPGWHIEDTAISFKELGEQYELHGGAVDLKFPHHEAEIAQAESVSGKKPFVKIWMHTGFLTTHGQKMSKSANNFVTIGDFLRTHFPQTLRLMVLSHHYRTPLDYAESTAESFEKSWQGVMETLGMLSFIRRHRRRAPQPKQTDATHFITMFHKALADDFNTPKALATIFEHISAIQPKIWSLGPKSAEISFGALQAALKQLGFDTRLPKISSKIEQMAKNREKYRANKQFAHSDALRKEIEQLGYVVDDTPLGPFVWPKNHK